MIATSAIAELLVPQLQLRQLSPTTSITSHQLKLPLPPVTATAIATRTTTDDDYVLPQLLLLL